MQQRETVTDRLADVIQVIQLGRRTGMLTVERGRDATFEEGTITFVNGQVTQASVGSRRGQEALRWLTAWRDCLFAFIAPSANELTALQSPSFSSNGSSHPQQNSNGNGRAQRLDTPTPKEEVPQRIKPVEEVLPIMQMMGLSRSHSRLLLLIDGQRNVSELIRLVGHSGEEIFQQLDELERAGFIKQ